MLKDTRDYSVQIAYANRRNKPKGVETDAPTGDKRKEKSGLQILRNVMKSVKYRPNLRPVRLIKYFANNIDYVLTNYRIKYV